MSHVLINTSSWAKHYSHVYDLMVPPTQEALAEDDKVRAME